MGETTRRSVLAGVAGAGAAAALAACGGGSSGTNGGSSANGGAAGSVLGKTSDVPLGGGKIFNAEKVVVTQPAAGQYKAFSSICTHMGCPVATVKDGTINCNCHGSQYSVTDGSVKTGPAQQPLPAKTVKVEGDNLVLG
jgi:Rieske Fe-S protein